ncbi:hypothetical protein B0H16DRAFT_1769345 [Mycena metata]|uniref:Uncharacterized protein n=1 Tax=Mycena metata TaxID=1033252 RepID=A0AAD7JV81_9AGAR|nr:hypothetical protein B0H16DRAFT_1769345 [Mycena metata]
MAMNREPHAKSIVCEFGFRGSPSLANPSAWKGKKSNLKAGHLLFFREGDDFNVETLLKAFGDLGSIYEASGYGKFAARLGMSFSSTVPTLEIKPAEEIEIVDLTALDGSLTSDCRKKVKLLATA